MADISEVSALLVSLATSAVYPNGTGSPSVTTKPVRLLEGWPIAAQLDADVSASPAVAQVSVFPLNSGSAVTTVQVFEEPVVLVPAVHHVSAVITGTSVALSGVPASTEYVSIIVDGRHSYSRTGANLAAIVSALLTDIQVDYPSATSSGTTITVTGSHSLVCRIGAPATMGHLIHRQKQQFNVTVWASNPADRTTLAVAIDLLFKQNLRIVFPDQSQGILTYERTILTDEFEKIRIYRRDLVYSVEYGTLEQFTAYEVTSFSAVDTSSSNDDSSTSLTKVS